MSCCASVSAPRVDWRTTPVLPWGRAEGFVRIRHMQTEDPDIYAVGDAVEVVEFVSGQPTQIPLAGPANRQGRIAADHIFGRESAYRGTQGTSVVGVFEMTAALTGLSEKLLQRMNPFPTKRSTFIPGIMRATTPAPRP